MNRRYLTVEAAAEYLGTTRGALYMKVWRRQIPYIKTGKRVKFDIRQLDALMQAGAREVLQ